MGHLGYTDEPLDKLQKVLFLFEVRSLDTKFAATRCMFKSHVRIVCTIPWHINECSSVLNGSPMILMHKPPNCFHIFRCLAHGSSPWPLVVFEWCSASPEAFVPLENTLHDSWPHFRTHIVSFQMSPIQICRVSRRIWCLLSAPVSHPCWNCKCEVTCGDKHWCCAIPNVHTATPLGILSGDVPCSQAQRTFTYCHQLAFYGTSLETFWYTYTVLYAFKGCCYQATNIWEFQLQ